jgi:predicted ester cyclase
MGIVENKETVRRYIKEILNDLDYSNVDELADKNFFGMGGTISSIEDHEKFFKAQREKIPDIRNNLMEMIAEEDKVVAISMVSGTDVGGYLSPKPTNKKFDCKVIAVYTLKEGKIVKGEILTDALTAYQQLGFYPPLPEEK